MSYHHEKSDFEHSPGWAISESISNETIRFHFQNAVIFASNVFVVFNAESESFLGKIVQFCIISITILGFIFLFLATVPAYRYQPTTCSDPVCDNDATLCPNTIICEPRTDRQFLMFERVVEIGFLIEYSMRFLTVWAVSSSVAKLDHDFLRRNIKWLAGRLYNTISKSATENNHRDASSKNNDSIDNNEGTSNDNGNENICMNDNNNIADNNGNGNSNNNDNKNETSFISRSAVITSIINSNVDDNDGDCINEINNSDITSNQNSTTNNNVNETSYSINKPAATTVFIIHPVWKQYFLFIIAFRNMIDFLCFAPLIIQTQDGSFLAFLRLIRLVRFWLLLSAADVAVVLYHTMKDSLDALVFIMFFSMFVVVLFGSIAFGVERGKFDVTLDYPQGAFLRTNGLSFDAKALEPSPYTSIPASMYWVITTMTTVGYGDIVPTSTLGRAIAVFLMYLGVMVMALPISVISNNFQSNFVRHVEEKKKIKAIRHQQLIDKAMKKKKQREQQQQQQQQQSCITHGDEYESLMITNDNNSDQQQQRKHEKNATTVPHTKHHFTNHFHRILLSTSRPLILFRQSHKRKKLHQQRNNNQSSHHHHHHSEEKGEDDVAIIAVVPSSDSHNCNNNNQYCVSSKHKASNNFDNDAFSSDKNVIESINNVNQNNNQVCAGSSSNSSMPQKEPSVTIAKNAVAIVSAINNNQLLLSDMQSQPITTTENQHQSLLPSHHHPPHYHNYTNHHILPTPSSSSSSSSDLATPVATVGTTIILNLHVWRQKMKVLQDAVDDMNQYVVHCYHHQQQVQHQQQSHDTHQHQIQLLIHEQHRQHHDNSIANSNLINNTTSSTRNINSNIDISVTNTQSSNSSDVSRR